MYTKCTLCQSDEQHEQHTRQVLSALNAGKWPFEKMTWRRISTMKPFSITNHANLSRYAKGDKVVNPDHRKAFGLLPRVTTSACPTCGGVCTYDCGTQKPVARPGHAKRKTPPRVIVYAGTPVEKVKQELREVTGIEWVPMVDELEY